MNDLIDFPGECRQLRVRLGEALLRLARWVLPPGHLGGHYLIISQEDTAHVELPTDIGQPTIQPMPAGAKFLCMGCRRVVAMRHYVACRRCDTQFCAECYRGHPCE